MNKKTRRSTKGKPKKLKSNKRNNQSNHQRKNKISKKNSNLNCPNGMNKLKTKNGTVCVGKCPHSGGPIYYNPKTDKFVCKWHGSQFDKSGKVLTPPANSNLKVKQL